MESRLNPKALLDSINDLEDALKQNDPHFIKKAAETVVVTRNRFFDTARSFSAAMMTKRE